MLKWGSLEFWILKRVNEGDYLLFSCLTVDASRAGAGNLELIVSVAGENVPNFVKAEGNARFEVSFTPHTPDTHMISVKFNGEVVPGMVAYIYV